MRKSIAISVLVAVSSTSAFAELISFKGTGANGSCEVSYSLDEKASIKDLTIVGDALMWEMGNLEVGKANYSYYETLNSRTEDLIMRKDFEMKKTLFSSNSYVGKGALEEAGTAEILVSGALNNPDSVKYTQKYKLFGLVNFFSITFDCKK